jgi:hypothetical protein
MTSRPPAHEGLVHDLRVLRERGLLRIRTLELPALAAAAGWVYASTGTGSPEEIERLLRAAKEYGGLSPETFRKGPERMLISRLADEILHLGPSTDRAERTSAPASRIGTEGQDVVRDLERALADLGSSVGQEQRHVPFDSDHHPGGTEKS